MNEYMLFKNSEDENTCHQTINFKKISDFISVLNPFCIKVIIIIAMTAIF